jgi:hypothetical protein
MDSLSPRDPASATIPHGAPLPWPSDLLPEFQAFDADALPTTPDALERLARYVLAVADNQRRAESENLWQAYRQWGRHSAPYREAWETWSRAYAIWREVAVIVGQGPHLELSALQGAPGPSAPDGAQRFRAE